MPTPTLGAPGVYVQENLTAIPPASVNSSPSNCAFLGEHWRGPIGTAIACRSWQDFVKYFGGFNPNTTPVLANPYLAYSVYMFFLNGGQLCYITRVGSAGTPGATAAVVLSDAQATPQTTLRLSLGMLGVIGNPGTWGNQVHYQISAMATTGRFTVTIYNGAAVAANQVEQWYDLSMLSTDARYAPSIINSPVAGSLWVVATDLADVAGFPTNAPAVGSGALSGGTDPADPIATDLEAAITVGTSALDQVQGALTFNLPGVSTAAVITSAITYAQTRGQAECVIDPPSGETSAAAVTYYGTLSPVVSYGALYSPWVVASNPASANANATILLPPGGAVMGQMVSTDSSTGVWRAPAGNNTVLAGVVQAERVWTPTDLANLNNSNINALKTLPNGQVIIGGARTLQSGYSSLYVSVRRTLNYIEAALIQMLDNYVFEPNDSATWMTISAASISFLGNLYSAGAFAGSTPASSYFVTCDGTNNTPQTIATGVLNVQVGLALITPIEFILLTISQFQGAGGSSVTSSI